MEYNDMLCRIKTNIDEALRREHFNGTILVSINEKEVIKKGYGMSNFELNIENSNKTKFRIGSITKQFTAASILQLYENGLLNLNDTLDKYIDNYPNGNNITIYNLLTHTSGIFNSTTTKDFRENMRKLHSIDNLVDEFKGKPFYFQPGEKFSYCNSGYLLLGFIIEKVTNKSYENYINDEILKKLKMNDSGYDNYKKIIKNRAAGYEFNKEENFIENCDFIDMSVPYAAGALYSTVDDLYTWNNNLINGKVINEDLVNEMFSNHIKCKEGFYGYGVFLDEVEFGGKLRKKIWHTGIIPGFLSCNEIFKEDNIQIIVITNITNNYFNFIFNKIELIISEGMKY